MKRLIWCGAFVLAAVVGSAVPAYAGCQTATCYVYVGGGDCTDPETCPVCVEDAPVISKICPL